MRFFTIGITDAFRSEKKWYAMPFCIFAVNYLLAIVFIAAPIAMVLIFVINPNRSMYAFSVLPDRWKAAPGVFPVFVLYETVMVFWIFSNLSVYFVYWCASVFQNLIWLNLLLQ